MAASGASVYTAGTYTATAKGMNDITVTMTFSDTAITEVKVDTANETLDLAVNSAADFQTMLMEAQSAEIDGVSGATVTSNAVKEAAADCIQQAMGLTGGAEDESTSYGDDPRGAARAAAKADGRVFGYSGPATGWVKHRFQQCGQRGGLRCLCRGSGSRRCGCCSGRCREGRKGRGHRVPDRG